MDAARVVAFSLAAGIAATSGARPLGEPDSAFIARTLSTSPMSPGSRVNARVTNCSLLIDEAVPLERKRLVIPLARLDERSFAVVQDTEWGWFVEVHTQQRRAEIDSPPQKRSDRLSEVYLHVYDQKNAERVRDALARVVRSCRHRAQPKT